MYMTKPTCLLYGFEKHMVSCASGYCLYALFWRNLLLRTVLTRPAKSGQFSNVIDSGSSSTAVLQQIKEIFRFYQFQSLMSNSTKIGYRFSLRSWEDPERVEINNPIIEEVRHRIIALLVAGRHIMAPPKSKHYTWQWWWTSVHAKNEKINNWFLHRLPCFHNWIKWSLCINLVWK